MAELRALLAKHDDIAKTLIEMIEMIVIMGAIVGLAPALIWLSSYGSL